MPGRAPLPVGKPGTVKVRHLGPRHYQARCRFRDLDGVTRQIAGEGVSKNAARERLLERLHERGMETEMAALRPHSRFREAAAMWLAKAEAKRRPTTVDTYRRWLDGRVLPDIGDWRLRECSVGQVDAYLTRLMQETVVTDGERTPRYKPNTLRAIRKVVSGPLELAWKHEALPANPVRAADDIEGQGDPPRALTIEERRQLRAWLRATSDRPEERDAQEAARRRDLPDLVDFMLGTGVRIGEALAVRWCDLDLEGVPVANPDGSLRLAPIVSVTGNIVRVKGKGLVRHEGKTAKARRTFELPRFVMEMLQRRIARFEVCEGETPVFLAATRNGVGWKDPHNTSTYIRQMRPWVGMDWMTSHNWRETAVTIWSDAAEMTDRATSDLAGHSDINFTKRTYVGRGELNPQSAGVMDAAFAD